MNYLQTLLGTIAVSTTVLLTISCKNSATKKTPPMVNNTFEITLTGTYTYMGPDNFEVKKCTDSLNAWRAVIDCEGTSDLLGELRAHLDFCGNNNGYYGNTFAYLVDSVGDTLFMDIKGQVIQGRTDELPEHVISYWHDSFTLNGGTGKFEGCSGFGSTKDYNSSDDLNSHHHWRGLLTTKEKLGIRK